MLTLGIDPGITGALAIIDQHGDIVLLEELPTLSNGQGRVKRSIDPAGLCHLLRIYAPDIRAAWIEQVSGRPGQGVASVFSLGHSAGAIAGVIAALGIPHHPVTPTTWKRAAGLPTADKEEARALATRLFPAVPLHRKRDHNLAEALLIAWYGWQAAR